MQIYLSKITRTTAPNLFAQFPNDGKGESLSSQVDCLTTSTYIEVILGARKPRNVATMRLGYQISVYIILRQQDILGYSISIEFLDTLLFICGPRELTFGYGFPEIATAKFTGCLFQRLLLNHSDTTKPPRSLKPNCLLL